MQANSETEPVKKTKKNYDLDSASDVFWANNSALPFPKIAVEVKNYVTEYSQSYEDFQKKYGSVDIDNYDEG